MNAEAVHAVLSSNNSVLLVRNDALRSYPMKESGEGQ